MRRTQIGCSVRFATARGLRRVTPWIALLLCVTGATGTSYGHDEAPPKKVTDEVAHRPSPIPDRIVLTWTGNPARSMAVTWRTDETVKQAIAEVQPADHGPLFTMNAVKVTAVSTAVQTNLGPAMAHAAQFVDLQPQTKYAYRVGDGANWSEWNHFVTASEQEAPFSFVYFGDAQNDLKSQWSRVVREAYSDAPKAAFLLHAGDLVNRGSNDADWGEWFTASSHIHRMVPCLPTPGNHEYEKTGDQRRLTPAWRTQFTLPENGPPDLLETAYWIDYQGTRFVSLNSNERQAEQAQWLDGVLSTNPCRWTVVTFHHPIYSSSRGRDNGELRAAWQPIFDKHHVDLVLQGHDHTYARSGPLTHENLPTGVANRAGSAGTMYVVSVSGPKMYALEHRPFMTRAAENTQLYQIVTIAGDELRYAAHTANGTLYDAFTLRKRPGQPNDLVNQIPDLPERRR